MSERLSGTVKWFNDSKGFGFIELGEKQEDLEDESEKNVNEDVFVHFRSIRGEGYRTLKRGARVEFEMTPTDKGFQAEDVAEI